MKAPGAARPMVGQRRGDLGQFRPAGEGPPRLVRAMEIAFRKPCFAGERARIEWVEDARTAIEAGASGFGTRLIETLVKRQLGGTLSRSIEEGRYRLVIEWPLKGAGG